MVRKMLTNRQWQLISPLLPGKASDPGRTSNSNRSTVEGIPWISRTGPPWRDLPPEFGRWGTVYQRFNRWTKAGVFDKISEATSGILDLRAVQVDGSFAKVHRHGTGAPIEDPRQTNRKSDKPSGEVVAG